MSDNSINKQVSKMGRFSVDREIPPSESNRRLQKPTSSHDRKKNLRKRVRMIRDKIYSNDHYRLERTMAAAHASRAMGRLGEEKQLSLQSNEGIISDVYRLRKAGHPENKIAALLSGKVSKRITKDTLFHNADHPNNFSRPDYHSPNSWHPNLSDEHIAYVYKKRKEGMNDSQIRFSLEGDHGIDLSHGSIRYNVDHFHAFRKAETPEFKKTHGTGYVPPVDIGSGNNSRKYHLTDKHTKKIKEHLRDNPNATVGGILKVLNLPKTARRSLVQHLNGEGIQLNSHEQNSLNAKKSRQSRPQDFHDKIRSMIYDHGMHNNAILANSEKFLGVKLTKGTLLGYIRRSGIGSNPNKQR